MALNVLLLGASGFVGARLLSSLVEAGHDIRVLSRKTHAGNHDFIEYVHGDLIDRELDLDQLLLDCDVVYNCAGEVRNESAMRDLHVQAIKDMLDAIGRSTRESARKLHFVQLSSVGAYGSMRGDRVVTEATPCNPKGTYEVTKTEADELIISSAQRGHFTFSIIRPSNIFAADMPNSSLRQLASMVKRGLFFFVGPSGAISTYVHVDDVVDVLLKAGFDERARNNIYNVSNDCPLEAMIGGLAVAMGVAKPRCRFPEFLVRMAVNFTPLFMSTPVTQERIDSLVSRTSYSMNKLKSELGFVPLRSVPDHIGEVISK